MDRIKYKPRILDAVIDTYLQTFGAVCIEGPKWCGKTWTSSYHSNSEIYISDPTGKAPAMLCVVCGLTNAAYKRADGVFVVPITSLAP